MTTILLAINPFNVFVGISLLQNYIVEKQIVFLYNSQRY